MNTPMVNDGGLIVWLRGCEPIPSLGKTGGVMRKRGEDELELLKRQAAGIASQLPMNRSDAVLVLNLAAEIIRNLGGHWGGPPDKNSSGNDRFMRLVRSDSPE